MLAFWITSLMICQLRSHLPDLAVLRCLDMFVAFVVSVSYRPSIPSFGIFFLPLTTTVSLWVQSR